MRDLKKYQDDYRSLAFEKHHVKARKRIVLEQINQIKPLHVLEIGCGLDPLGSYLNGKTEYTLIEPAPDFFDFAERKLENVRNVNLINSTFENTDLATLRSTDFVVVSCLLHELQDRESFLRQLKSLFSNLSNNAVCHINVPNSNSLHRKLAVSMGLVDKANVPSDTQVRMQQSGIVYDYESLTHEMYQYGFRAIADGGILLKPFTHEQMYQILSHDIIGADVIIGLEKLGVEMKEISSEIWVNFCYG